MGRSQAEAVMPVSIGSLQNGAEVNLFCLGHIDGPRWLDGRTHNGSVGLAPGRGGPFTGTRWRVERPNPGDRTLITLFCLGHLDGPRWLDGRTHDGSVGLAPDTGGPFVGTRWRIGNPDGEQDASIVNILCVAGSPDGLRWLDGRTHDGSVGLAPDRGNPFTGTRWQLSLADAID